MLQILHEASDGKEKEVCLLEHMVGGELVVDTALAEWEKLGPKGWLGLDPHVEKLAGALGHPLVRMPEKPRAAFQKRVKKLVDAAKGSVESIDTLDLAFFGAAAKSCPEPNAWYADHVTDAAWLRKAAEPKTGRRRADAGQGRTRGRGTAKLDGHRFASISMLHATLQRCPRWASPRPDGSAAIVFPRDTKLALAGSRIP